MVELVRAGRRPEELAKEFEPSAQAIRNLVTQADRDEGRWADGLTTAEREELIRDHPIVTFRRARDRATSQAHRIFCMEGKHMKTHLASAIVVAGLFALASSQAFAWTCVADNSNPRAGFRAGTGVGTGFRRPRRGSARWATAPNCAGRAVGSHGAGPTPATGRVAPACHKWTVLGLPHLTQGFGDL